MKFKISWPTGIILALGAFMIFILTYLYLSFTPKYSHTLVSEEYYKDELNYQKEIDEENKGIALMENISLKKVADGLLIVFPKEFKASKISGNIHFKRLSNGKIDFNLPIKLKTNEFLIKKENLLAGRWDVNIEWKVNNTNYLFKEKLMY